jgi:hypothetical protein
MVGSGLGVEVGKLVAVGIGVSVGCAMKTLQAVEVTAKIEKIINWQMVFIFSHTFLCLSESPTPYYRSS